MGCSIDLKEYILGESSREDAKLIQAHMEHCGECRDEFARLQLTQASLLALRDEEMPRRIAFVSDKVFEPRWHQRLWSSAARLGFAAAAMLAFAIVVHGFVTRPPSAPVAATVDTQAMEREVSARVNAAVQSAVTKAVADSEARQRAQTVQLIKALEQRYELDQRATMAAFSEQTRIVQKQMNNMYVAANKLGVGE